VVFRTERPRKTVEAVLRRMNAAQAHRGPDGEGLWTDGRVGLGHRRLALVGDENHGREPLPDGSGCQLVYNGELWRPAEVMAGLGLQFEAGDSDAHVLHELLAQRGPQGLAQVEGFFAAVRYEPARGRLTLVRDAWGKKPLYLYRTPQATFFASTTAALRAGAGGLGVRPEALLEYLVYRSVGGYRSAFQNVEQLPPGGWLELSVDGSERAGRWFELPAPDRDAIEPAEVRQAVDFAVSERLDANFEQGIFLSGGLDSSIVADSAARQREDGAVLRFYSVGYDVPGMQDERPLARQLAGRYPFVHQEVTLHAAQLPELFRDVARFLEDPIQDPVTLPTLLLCRAAAQRTKCVLTGDGSDEFWGGYERFDDPPERLEDYFPRTQIFAPTELGLAGPPATYLDQVELPPSDWGPLERILLVEARNRLRNYHLARIDKLGMATGLEIRSPFLDRRVTCLALSLPARLKRPEGVPKGLLLEAFRDTLPQWLLERKKQPFSMPIHQWLTGPLHEYARDTLGPNSRTAPLVDAGPYLDALDGPQGESRAARIWSLLALEAWLEVMA